MSLPAAEMREMIGPYRLIRAIGAGGSARIDLARIERAYNFQRHVVIKRPLEHLRGDANVAASLRREARIGGRLRHPNLVAVLDAGEHDGYDYLVLEYVHGASLRTVMQTEEAGHVREVPLPVALGIAIDVARGLHDAHELTDERGSPLGLVHRDVSPANVLVDLDGSVKLADFGIAKETRVSTLSGSMHGTVTYMAPEQCRGHAFDRRADIFSIGVILYELVTRTRLFWAENDVASLHRVLSGDIVPPRKLAAHVSPALEEIVMTAVAQSPDKRFGNARQLADALEGLAAVEGHVLGARWIARAVEEVVGAKMAPWIGTTTMPDSSGRGEGSLVAVIESLAPEDASSPEPRLPTFGPSDRRDAEEGLLPVPLLVRATSQPPAAASRPARKGHGRLYTVIAVGMVVGVLGALGLSRILRGDHDRGPASTAPNAATMTATPPTSGPGSPPAPGPAPTPPTGPAPAPAIDSVPTPAPVASDPAPVVTDPTPAPPPVRTSPGSNRRRHPQLPVHVAGSAAPVPPAPGALPAQPATPPAAPPTNVEWNTQILLPTDRVGSGSGAGSARPK